MYFSNAVFFILPTSSELVRHGTKYFQNEHFIVHSLPYLNLSALGQKAIVCTMNLTETNISYFNDYFFKKVKKDCLFINISRGEISPTIILEKYLEDGTLGGIGLDVFDDEKNLAIALREKKSPSDDIVKLILKLNQKQNVILTPHNAFNTEESIDKKSRQTVEQLKYFMDHGIFKWNVD